MQYVQVLLTYLGLKYCGRFPGHCPRRREVDHIVKHDTFEPSWVTVVDELDEPTAGVVRDERTGFRVEGYADKVFIHESTPEVIHQVLRRAKIFHYASELATLDHEQHVLTQERELCCVR